MAFCGCELRLIYDNVPVAEVKPLTDKDYRPCCMTPLYDAIGTTISRVHAAKAKVPGSLAMVTVITDGYENASREYTLASIRALIESYKEQGWQFTYIGADHDVEAVSFSLHIDHHLKFEKTAAGTHAMFAKERKSRNRWMSKMSSLSRLMDEEELPESQRIERIKNANKEDYFDED